jgi:hypothetical protein
MPRDGTVHEPNADLEFDLVRRALMVVIFVLLVLIVGSFVF